MSKIREKLSISWKYFSRFTKHRVFRLHPFLVVFRGISLSFLLLLGKSKVISIKYGSQKFKFNFVPRGRNQGGRGLFLYREQIEPLMEFGHRLLKEGDVVLDGGANQGVFTTAFSAAVGSNGQVIYVEPFDYCHDLIKQNIALNKKENVLLFKNVLVDVSKEYLLDFTQGVGKSSILRDFGGDKTLRVEGITIHDIVNKLNLERLDLIKLDVEGAELIALRGGMEMIDRFKPAIVLECERASYSEIYDLLGNIGYKSYLLDAVGRLESITSLQADEDNVFFLRENHLTNFQV